MSAEAQTTGPLAPSTGGRLPQGASLADDRWSIRSFIASNGFFDHYAATDTHTNDVVSVFVTDGTHAPNEAIVRARTAIGIRHKNLAEVLDVGKTGEVAFVVTAFHEGHSLRTLLERKRATGSSSFTAKATLNVLKHIHNALGALPGDLAHGLIGLDTVVVDKSGRVIVTAVGLGPMVVNAAPGGAAPPWPSLAPELAKGAPLSAAVDVYALGCLVYQLLVGSDPVKGCKRPSEVVETLAGEVDILVGACMNPVAGKRPASVTSVIGAAKIAFAKERVARPLAAQLQPAVQRGGKRPSLAHAIASPQVEVEPNLVAPNEALSTALDDNDDHWLISMGNLDYGPFTLAQIVEKINSDEILPGHMLVDRHTGNRQAVEENPLLSELVDQATLRRDEDRRARAEMVHASTEKRRGLTLYAVIAIGVLGLGGGAYALVGALSASRDSSASGGVDSLEEASLQAKITFPTKKKRDKKRRKKGSSGGGVAGGWDDSTDMDLAEGGGDERLDNSQINPVIQKHGGKLGRCLSSTGSRSADIDFIIKGTGKVSQVRVNGETSGPLANCLRGAMRSMQFPTFDGSRTKANFNMSL